MRPIVWRRMLLCLLAVSALGCSQAGNVKQQVDGTSQDGSGEDATFDILEDSVDKDSGIETVDPDSAPDLDVDPDAQQQGGLVSAWGLVSSGGTATSTDHKLVWRVWEQLPPVRATSTNFNFFGGIVRLP